MMKQLHQKNSGQMSAAIIGDFDSRRTGAVEFHEPEFFTQLRKFGHANVSLTWTVPQLQTLAGLTTGKPGLFSGEKGQNGSFFCLSSVILAGE